MMEKHLLYKVTINKKGTEAEIEEVDDIDVEKLIERDTAKKPATEDFCPSCGYELWADYKFCHNCGQRIDRS